MAETYNMSMSGLMSYSLTDQIGTPKHKAKEPTFEEEALMELEYEFKSKKTEEDSLFIICKREGYYYYTDSEAEIMKTSLVSQNYIGPATNGHYKPCVINAVFYREKGKFKMLYKNKRYFLNKKPLFLSKSFLKQTLKKVFAEVSISLGCLTYNQKAKHIAWKIATEKGDFYIPWHNGLPIKASETLTFEEKSYESIRNTYSILRFMEGSPHSERDFVATCG